MSDTRPPQIKEQHIQLFFVVYARQSTPGQVLKNTGSTAHQRGLGQYGLAWGWAPEAIRIYDGDLGQSGRSEDDREDLQELKELIRQKKVGLLMTSNSARLNRNVRDSEDLMALCRATDTLLAIEGSILDLSDSTHRLMARMRSNFDVYENEQRTENFMKGRRAKALAGKAVSHPPTGYVSASEGRWDKDPDGAVREAFEEVFRQLDRLGSVPKVMRYFRDHHLEVPTRHTAKGVTWLTRSKPSVSRIYRIVTNPAYAGYYVYGRKLQDPAPPEGGQLQVVWDTGIVVPGHHEPYCPPADWHRMQERLRQNNFMRGAKLKPREGTAVSVGLVECGACGRRMGVNYYTSDRGLGFQYRCNQAHQRFGEPLCWRVPGMFVDHLVQRELLAHLAAPEIGDVLAAAQGANQGYEAACRQRAAELTRAEYEAARLERMYKQEDPENRLVTATLGKDWQRELERVEQLKRRHTQIPLAPALTLAPEDLEAIRRVSADLPALWGAPSTTIDQKREVVRLFFQAIRITASTAMEFEVDLVWAGGAVTHHRVFRPQAGPLLAKARKAEGKSNREIATELSTLGLTTWKKRQPYTREAVQGAVRAVVAAGRAGLAPWPTRARELQPLLTDLVTQGRTDAQIAEEFNRRGVVGYTPGAPWTTQKVMILRVRLAVRSDLAWQTRKATLRQTLEDLTLAGLSDPKIAEEFTRRGLPGFRGETRWTCAKIAGIRQTFGIPSARYAGVRREALRPLLVDLIGQKVTDAAIAAELNRRGLDSLTPGTPWTLPKVITLRRSLGLHRGRGGRRRRPADNRQPGGSHEQ